MYWVYIWRKFWVCIWNMDRVCIWKIDWVCIWRMYWVGVWMMIEYILEGLSIYLKDWVYIGRIEYVFEGCIEYASKRWIQCVFEGCLTITIVIRGRIELRMYGECSWLSFSAKEPPITTHCNMQCNTLQHTATPTWQGNQSASHHWSTRRSNIHQTFTREC